MAVKGAEEAAPEAQEGPERRSRSSDEICPNCGDAYRQHDQRCRRRWLKRDGSIGFCRNLRPRSKAYCGDCEEEMV